MSKKKRFIQPHQIRLSSGRLVVLDEDGNIHLGWDKHGAPDLSPLSTQERTEARQMLSDSVTEAGYDEAQRIHADPDYVELRDHLLATRSQEELEVLNRDPVAFGKAVEEAREEVSPSWKDIEQTDEKADRLKAVKKEIAATNRKGGRFDPDAWAEYLDLRAETEAAEEGDGDE